MAEVYRSFLQRPQGSMLADNATLHYITTTTSFKGADAILSHLQAERKELTKKSEKVLSCVEGTDTLSMEIDTTFKILQSGGVYLPQLEGHLIADMEPRCPMLHFVQFDQSGKISQIRIHWDQSTMLKQVEAIGKSGRNWPIRDGQAQVELVEKSLSLQPAPAPAPRPSRQDQTSQAASGDSGFRQGPPRHDYQTRLFETAEKEPYRVTRPADAVPPRESARPQDRAYGDLFPDGSYREQRQDRPSNTRRYDHFEFGEGDSPHGQRAISHEAADKQTSHWNYGDRETPQKTVPRYDPEHERHFGHDIDEPQKTPYHLPVVHRPRPDIEPHFSLDNQSPSEQKQPLRDNSNISNARRNREMESDLNSTSASASVPDEKQRKGEQVKIYKTAGDGLGGRAGARTWDIFGDGEEETQTETKRTHVYKTYGNGMGGRRDAATAWQIGD